MPSELTVVSGLPIAAPSLAGIRYGSGPRLAPPIKLPTKGRVFGRSSFPATQGQPLAQPIVGALQHTAILGPTGAGKSTLLANLIQADLQAGRGALVVDLKGDLVDDLLSLIPEHRHDEVILLDPASGDPQPGLALFPTGGDAELTSDLILGTLRELFSESWGVRSSQYLGLGLKTLAANPGSTLIELPLLFTDADFRSQALKRVHDPWLMRSWQRFLALSPADQAVQLSSPLTKLEELIGRARLRVVLGQRRPSLDFHSVLSKRQIVLVRLPPGLLGMPATRLLTALTLWQFFQSVEGRAAVPASRRSPFMAYIDEVGILASLPLPLESLFTRSRGHGVGITLSPQALSQLTPAVRTSLVANVGSLVAFAQTSEEEAAALARALPGVSSTELQHLEQHEVAMRLSLGPGVNTAPMTGVTLPLAKAISDPVAVRARAARFGQTLAAVDAELEAPEPQPVRASSQLGIARRQP